MNKTDLILDTEGSFGVICQNREEAAYMIEWCRAKGWLPPTLNVDLIANFPWVACLDFDQNKGSWTDHLDRAMKYKTFVDFIRELEKLRDQNL